MRHMELSLDDLNRILNPASATPEEQVRRERLLTRARTLASLSPDPVTGALVVEWPDAVATPRESALVQD
jgi:hypothetical protein